MWATSKKDFEQKKLHTPMCPICNKDEESSLHVIKCTSNTTDGKNIWKQYIKDMTNSKIDENIRKSIISNIAKILDIEYISTKTSNKELDNALKEAENSQSRIKWELLLRGFISKKYREAQNIANEAGKSLSKSSQEKILGAHLDFSHNRWKLRCKNSKKKR